ncbi:MAG: MFS transporter [Thermoplasmata archaeon]|nr:MAG: MFS transporter [Thermoplasmata archaeon]
MEEQGNGKASGPQPGSALKAVLGLRNFRLLWLGETISLMGDQFYFIALPWLVLMLSGDPLALGTILALVAVPRALFMLVGGALTDRISPRMVMIGSNFLRLMLVLSITALVFTDIIKMWMIYFFALAFGVGDGFFYPAQLAIIPQIVKKKHLQVANSLIMGMMQVTMFAGPVLAGLVIATFATSETDLTGIGYAFFIDALTFLISLITLAMISISRKKKKDKESMIDSIKHGLAYVWANLQFRAVLIVIFVVNFLLVGPIIVGIPVIADTKLAGAVSYGFVMTAYGGGSLLGIALAGGLPRPPKYFGSVLLVVTAIMGLGLFSLAFFQTTALVALAALVMGAANGYVMILGLTWFQSRTEESMMGRMMSLVMFSGAGIAPVSMALTGVLLDWNMELMYLGLGSILIIFTLGLAITPYVRGMKFDLEEEKAT